MRLKCVLLERLETERYKGLKPEWRKCELRKTDAIEDKIHKMHTVHGFQLYQVYLLNKLFDVYVTCDARINRYNTMQKDTIQCQNTHKNSRAVGMHNIV